MIDRDRSGAHARATAARLLHDVVHGGRSLNSVLRRSAELAGLSDQDRAFVRECVSGVLRYLPRYRFYLARLLNRPLKRRDADLEMLLLTGLHQLCALATPDHAAVSGTVAACDGLDKPWTKALVNAVLRKALRDKAVLADLAKADTTAFYSHPPWLIEAIRRDWADDWRQILEANNAKAPMTLRVNLARSTRAAYLNLLQTAGIVAQITQLSAAGIRLARAVDVSQLPGFDTGLVSVQDEAAQLAPSLLDVHAGQRVLDACAAPGGKTAHIAETGGPALLVALEVDAVRAGMLDDTLRRLRVDAAIKIGDAARPKPWWDGVPFDRILVDAPCSATGVIRRQPDVKLHRVPADIPALQGAQCAILDGVWPLLARGGKLLYATCSVLSAENDAVIENLITEHPDAAVERIDAPYGRALRHGRQILPGEQGMDGFYYARVAKP